MTEYFSLISPFVPEVKLLSHICFKQVGQWVWVRTRGRGHLCCAWSLWMMDEQDRQVEATKGKQATVRNQAFSKCDPEKLFEPWANSESDWFLTTVMAERCGQPSSPWQRTLSSGSSVIRPSAPSPLPPLVFRPLYSRATIDWQSHAGRRRMCPQWKWKDGPSSKHWLEMYRGVFDSVIYVVARQTVSKMLIWVVWGQTEDLIRDASSRLSEFLLIFFNNSSEAAYNFTQACSVRSVSKCVSIKADCIFRQLLKISFKNEKKGIGELSDWNERLITRRDAQLRASISNEEHSSRAKTKWYSINPMRTGFLLLVNTAGKQCDLNV